MSFTKAMADAGYTPKASTAGDKTTTMACTSWHW